MALIRGELTLEPPVKVGGRNYIPESKTMTLSGWHHTDDMPTDARTDLAITDLSTVMEG